MWHFISWIETDNEPNILFLTDAEVYDDPEGRDVLRPYRHDDVLGHDAIRSYCRLSQGAAWSIRNDISGMPTCLPSLPRR